jgi:hypothetical protein
VSEGRSGKAAAQPISPATRLELGLLALILLLALALRLWALGEVPPGLHVDEGHNGVDALRIMRGWRPMFLPGNDGREALYSYVQAPLVAWLGPTAFALRLASALLGIAGVWATWLWVRRLPLAESVDRGRSGGTDRAPALGFAQLEFAPIAALATVFVTATTYWHLHFSRIAIRGILLPLIASLAAAALWRALRGRADGRTRWAWATTGALYALAFYAHPAGRLLALVPLPPLLWLGWRSARRGDRGAVRALLHGSTTAALSAMVLLLPLAVWASRHPDVFFAHSVSVSVLDPAVHEGEPLRRIVVNAWRTMRALAWRGSGSWYHNLRDRPVLDPLSALLWAGGLWWLAREGWGAARRARAEIARQADPRLGERDPLETPPLVGTHDPVLVAVFLTGWLGVMALPTVLTSGAPNFSRAIGLLPALLLPAGLAMAGVDVWLRRRGMRGTWRTAILAALLAPGAGLTARDHFVIYAAAKEPAIVFGAHTSEKALLLRSLAAEPNSIILTSPIIEQRAVLRFLSDSAGPGLVSVPHPADILVPAVGQARYAFDFDEEEAAAAAFAERWPELARGERKPESEPEPESRPSAIEPWIDVLWGEDGTPRWLLLDAPAVRSAATSTETESSEGLPVFDGTLALLAVERLEEGHRTTPPFAAWPGDTIELVLWWEAQREPQRDWTRFTHLVDGAGRSYGQQDGAPFGGRLPTGRWAAGDRIGTLVTLRVDESAPHGSTLRIRVGWHDPATGERLPLPDDDDAAAEVAVVEIR